jgi:hypothetical protein
VARLGAPSDDLGLNISNSTISNRGTPETEVVLPTHKQGQLYHVKVQRRKKKAAVTAYSQTAEGKNGQRKETKTHRAIENKGLAVGVLALRGAVALVETELGTTENLEGVDLVGKSSVWVVERGQDGGSRVTSDLPGLEGTSGDGRGGGDGGDVREGRGGDRRKGVDGDHNGSDEGFGKSHFFES